MPLSTQRPKKSKESAEKNKKYTLKGQVVLDSNLRIICTAIAMTNTHDFKLFKQSRLPIKKETLVCVDTG